MMSAPPERCYGLHVIALARAWRAGASGWPIDKRIDFANDTDLNLLAVDGPTNQAKRDQGLDTWVPPNVAFRCEYAHRYLGVAAAYQLAVTVADINVARQVCAQQH